jgi:hypothetical protein
MRYSERCIHMVVPVRQIDRNTEIGYTSVALQACSSRYVPLWKKLRRLTTYASLNARHSNLDRFWKERKEAYNHHFSHSNMQTERENKKVPCTYIVCVYHVKPGLQLCTPVSYNMVQHC